MQDKSLNPYVHRVPPCPLSTECIRLIDELERCDSSRWIRPGSLAGDEGNSSDAGDLREAQLVEQLCAHVPTCLTCTITVARMRQMRTQQRRALRGWLAEGEQQVPATSARILSVIRHEQETPRHVLAALNGKAQPVTGPAQQQMESVQQGWPLLSPRTLIFLVAVCVIVLALLVLFGRLMPLIMH